MIHISEQNNGSDYAFNICIIKNGQETNLKKIKISKVSINEGNFTYLLLYDKNMRIIRDVYKYLNIGIKEFSINTRNMMCSSLILLYSFLEIFNCNINNLTKKDIDKLKTFLIGGSLDGCNYVLNNITFRANSTVNNYLCNYKKYLKYLGIENKVFNQHKKVRVERGGDGFLGNTKFNIYEKYTVYLRTSNQRKTVPRYIKPEEFQKILDVIKNYYSIREEIICRLMFENGLRLGEVLGLTIEDIEDNILYIRNRISDKPDQHAKYCFIPQINSDYNSIEFNTRRVGYHIIKPTLQVMDKINEYIDIYHGKMSKNNRGNYCEYAKADKVSKGNYLEIGNFYLFLNKNASPLRTAGWNKILRNIFKLSGISVDKKSRKHNLSHRMRHGFAMKRVKIDNVSPLQLMEDLRHKNLSSVSIYFNPTEDDIYDANDFASKTMIDKMNK